MRTRGGFTLVEMMVAAAASVIVMGGLLAGSIGIQRTLHHSEEFSANYSSTRRMIDAVARDLRRSVAIEVVTSGGGSMAANGQTVTLSDEMSVVLRLPGYYRSDDPAHAGFDQPLPVVNTDAGPTYGSGNTPAPTVAVTFRKFFAAHERCVCFVREEAAARQTIVRNADDLHITLSFSPDARSCSIEAWFQSPFSNKRRVVATTDRVMLRNALPPL